MVKVADAIVEGQICSVVPRPRTSVFDVIPMFPLIPHQVMKLQKKAGIFIGIHSTCIVFLQK